MTKPSTADSVCEWNRYTYSTFTYLDSAKDICLVFLDESKAFDKVYHPALLHKLERII